MATGTQNNDSLTGGPGDDSIAGLGGNDTIDGLGGRDSIDGGSGNDVINDSDGLDSILGGIGDDKINVLAGASAALGSVDAGDGIDDLTILLNIDRPYTASMGAGNDHVKVLGISWNLTLSLGAGSDSVELPAFYSANNGGVLIFTDFQAGTGGDTLNVDGWLEQRLSLLPSLYWSPGENPFAQGWLELRQAGADVELWLNLDGAPLFNSFRQAVFAGKTLGEFTAGNFGGYDPQAVPNNAQILRDDSIVGAGETEAALDTTPVFTLRPHYVYAAQDGVFVNHGTVTSTQATLPGGHLAGIMVSPYHATTEGALFLNAEDGTFLVEDQWVDESGTYFNHLTYGLYAQDQWIGFQNDGDFEVSAVGGNAWGLLTGFRLLESHPLVNNGTFVVQCADGAAWGVELGAGGSFENNGEMLIHGGDFAVAVYSGQYHGQSIVNHGTITVTTDADSPSASVGVWLPQIEAPFGGSYQHWNSGTITADIALVVEELNTHLPHDFVDVLHNSGTINGEVFLGAGNDQILNTGSMSGGSFLAEGDDLYDGTAGSHSGWVEGGAGADTLRGGAGEDDFVGGEGDDSLSGGAGDDTLQGDAGNDTFAGGAGANVYFDDAGDDTYFVSSRDDHIHDGAGNDTLYVSVDDFKVPIGIESVVYVDGARPLAYFLDAVVSGERWSHFGSGNVELSYGFLSEATDGAAAGGTGFYAFTAEQEDLARDALEKWSEVSGLSFIEATDAGSADLKFGSNDQDDFGSLGYAYYPPDAEIYIDHDEGFLLGVLIHETGHALGLKHPFEEPGVLSPAEDNNANTVMSYTPASGDEIPAVLGPFDLAAIHFLYGVNAAARSGNDSYGFDEPYVWDGAGDDTLTAAGETLSAYIRLDGGSWNWVGAQADSILDAGQSFLGFGTAIENATGGSGNDTLIGNALANRLDGGAGADSMAAGAGDDTYFVDDAGDIVVENAGEGIDTLVTTLSVALLAASLENVTFIGPGDGTIVGNAADNVLAGNAFNNTLNGGAGTDTASYAGAAGGVTVSLAIAGAQATGGAGSDTLIRIENLAGSPFGDSLTGDGSNNLLSGGAGNDTLAGGGGGDTLDGGAGTDSMTGGNGDDSYTVDSALDVCNEAAGGGTDTVSTSVDFDIQNNIEILTLLGSGNLRGGGNVQANTLNGNSGNNLLDGRGGNDALNGADGNDSLSGSGGDDTLDGGSGVDSMAGGTGNDTYCVDSASDVCTEARNEGSDTVYSSVSYTLTNNIESLVLLGSDDLSGTGSGLANTITGNGGANLLDGRNGADTLDGGAGADTLVGGPGNDSFYVDDASDMPTEALRKGTDTIYSSMNWNLNDNVENLRLLGSANVQGGGNPLSNVIVGNSGTNFLQGRGGDDTLDGGAGTDVLNGGTGADTFLFASANSDRIQDFELGVDHIALDNAVFIALEPDGALDAGWFYSATGALQGLDADDYVIYNRSTGALYYDADGAGGAAGVQVAILTGKPLVTATDVVVV